MLPKYNVTCVFEGGTDVSFQASPIETIYQAASRQGLPLQTDCREGACAVCKAFRASGDGDVGDVSEEALPPDEESEGYVLTCQFRARSDCVLEFAYPLSLIRDETYAIKGTVEQVTMVADDVAQVLIRTTGDEVRFLPGQYVNISVPGKVQPRSFSFANRPGTPDLMEFFVRILPHGQMSDYLRNWKSPGDEAEITGPLGQFFLRPPGDRHIVMIAGGTGLAPMLAMLDHIKATSGEALPNVSLLYGVNKPGELFALDRIKSFGDWIDLKTIAVGADDDWQGPTGVVTDLIGAGGIENPDCVDAYLCGPPPMIEAARQLLSTLGVPAQRIFAEKFRSSGR